MKKPEHITRPELKSATTLSPMELNRLRFSDKKTLLTPERLERMATATSPKPAKGE